MNELPVVIIGAGPVGLATATHLLANKQRFTIIEKGEQAGSHILEWGHVQLFSPWQYNIDQEAKKLLIQTEWLEPQADKLPTGKEFVDEYLEPLAKLPFIKEHTIYSAKVIAITKKNTDKMKSTNRENIPFVVYIELNGKVERIEAKSVIDASGTWSNPNPPFADGVWRVERNKVHSHIPNLVMEENTFKDKHIAIIGSGHSAQNTLIDLAKLKEKYPKTKLTWIMRKKHIEDVFGGEKNDELQARGELGSNTHEIVDRGIVDIYTDFHVDAISEENGTYQIVSSNEMRITEVEEIIVNTGSRPDFTYLSELRLNVDPIVESTQALASLIDPNLHSCGTVRPHGEKELRQPEQGLYIVGVKSYGRAPTFLMATGYEQVRSITAYLSGDREAAERVELQLPNTGVCQSNRSIKELNIVSINSSVIGGNSCC